MLTVQIICVGKLKEGYLQQASAEYQKRLGAFCRLQIVELPEYKLPQNPSAAQIQKGIEQEGQSILHAMQKSQAFQIPLCIEGKERSSEQLAQLLSQAALEGNSTVNFIIGGSYGLADAVKAQGNVRLSMSPMTFPHQLARIMLLEQIYRAFQINAGGKYHK